VLAVIGVGLWSLHSTYRDLDPDLKREHRRRAYMYLGAIMIAFLIIFFRLRYGIVW